MLRSSPLRMREVVLSASFRPTVSRSRNTWRFGAASVPVAALEAAAPKRLGMLPPSSAEAALPLVATISGLAPADSLDCLLLLPPIALEVASKQASPPRLPSRPPSSAEIFSLLKPRRRFSRGASLLAKVVAAAATRSASSGSSPLFLFTRSTVPPCKTSIRGIRSNR